MHCFDFLSDKPKIYIFQKETNKTNLGGILFLIYIIIMLLISSAYIVDYAINDKYSYDVMTVYNYTDQDEEENMNNDLLLNPYINLSITIYSGSNFVIYDNIRFYNLEPDYINSEGNYVYNIRNRVNDTEILIFYLCKTKNCTETLDQQGDNFGDLEVYYSNYKINHFDEIPVQYMGDNEVIYSQKLDKSAKKGTMETMTFKWEVIKYKEQRSLFDPLTNRQTEYIFGHFKNDEPKEELKDIYADTGYYILLYNIIFTNKHKEYLLYKRRKVDILDVLANIGALFSTIKYFFSLFFYYYSKNFDNYKLIQNILNVSIDPIKEIELSTDFNPSSSTKIKENNEPNDINNYKSFIDKPSNENKMIINNSDINSEDNIDDNYKDSIFSLKSIHFYHYFFNNIYCKCCKKISNQEIIDHLNEIIYKYLSVDALLYNQIKLENLFRDYKWNNPLLNNIRNNKYIINLKKYCVKNI